MGNGQVLRRSVMFNHLYEREIDAGWCMVTQRSFKGLIVVECVIHIYFFRLLHNYAPPLRKLQTKKNILISSVYYSSEASFYFTPSCGVYRAPYKEKCMCVCTLQFYFVPCTAVVCYNVCPDKPPRGRPVAVQHGDSTSFDPFIWQRFDCASTMCLDVGLLQRR